MSFGLHCPIVVYEDFGHVLVMQDSSILSKQVGTKTSQILQTI
jgi:hypothetical protein